MLGHLLRSVVVPLAAVNTDLIKNIASLPAKYASVAFHKAHGFMLVDEKFGAVHFVNDELKPTMREVAALHARAANGENVTDEEWSKLSDAADKAVSEKVTGAFQDPVSKLMQASTSKEGGMSALNGAAETLIMLITMAGSQSAPSAAANAVAALVPGGRLTQDAVRRVLLKKLTSLVKVG